MNKEQTITGIIRGTGACVPKRVLDNNEIAGFVDTSDEWIQERTGVKRRRIVESETTVSMASEAGRQALEEAGVLPEEVEMILVATGSADRVFPCTACQVQEALGAVGAVGFDLNAACSGFLFAYNTAQAYISAGIYRTILVIGSESLSRLVDWTDRGTCILFGDGPERFFSGQSREEIIGRQHIRTAKVNRHLPDRELLPESAVLTETAAKQKQNILP